MYNNLITTINYPELIRMQANSNYDLLSNEEIKNLYNRVNNRSRRSIKIMKKEFLMHSTYNKRK